MLNEKEIREIVESVIKNLSAEGSDPMQGLSMAGGEKLKKEENVLDEDIVDLMDYDLYQWTLVPEPADPEGLRKMKASTPARVGIWRSGPRPRVETWLRFRADHAKARDAVWKEIAPDLAGSRDSICVKTKASCKEEYLTRPDLGRQLSEEGHNELSQSGTKNAQIQLVITDGLSSAAIEENVSDFIPAFEETIKSYGLTMGKPIFVRYGRVAVMDQIGEILNPEVVVELVGERPGLVTASSMSAYLCYRPSGETIESDRTLVANIHSGGLPAVEAGAHVAGIAKRIFEAKESGMKIRE